MFFDCCQVSFYCCFKGNFRVCSFAGWKRHSPPLGKSVNLWELQKAKKRRQRHFYIGGSCRMTRFARPSGRRRKRLRCLTAFDSNLPQVYSSHPETRPSGQRFALFKIVPDNFVESSGSAESKKAPPAPFLHWWVVQDDSLRSPFGPSPQTAPLSHCVRLEPAAGSNLQDRQKAKKRL